MNQAHEGNRACWNGWAPWWRERRDKVGVWSRCPSAPELVLSPGELRALGDIAGQRVAVLASGDNEVAFALAGMGARVTSVDISEGQLAIAAERAEKLGIEIAFLRSDITDCAMLDEGSFDLIHTGGGVAVWMSDLDAYMRETARLLKPGGMLLVNDFHPFAHLQSDETPWPLKDYFDRGPFSYTSNEGFPGSEYHWTVADRLQAVLNAGLTLTWVEEHDGTFSDLEAERVLDEIDTDTAPKLHVPRYLLIVARKPE